VPRPETRVLLVRHGKTSDPDRFHGAESDVGLSERGIRQAELLARQLVGLRPAAIYSSGMRRALETAEPIARACGLAPATIDALHECRLGSLSSQGKDEAGARYAELIGRWAAGDFGFKLEGGESYVEVQARIRGPFQELAGRSSGLTIAIVTHGLVIRVLLTSLLDGYGPSDFERLRIRTGSLSDLRWDGARWSATALDDRPRRHS
jgi:broad specificity phosphatase PhoE